jgi:hypothetical protein
MHLHINIIPLTPKQIKNLKPHTIILALTAELPDPEDTHDLIHISHNKFISYPNPTNPTTNPQLKTLTLKHKNNPHLFEYHHQSQNVWLQDGGMGGSFSTQLFIINHNQKL